MSVSAIIFVVQKLVSRLLFPVPLTLIAGLLGLLLIARGRSARGGAADGGAADGLGAAHEAGATANPPEAAPGDAPGEGTGDGAESRPAHAPHGSGRAFPARRGRQVARFGFALTGAAFAFLWLASTAPVSDALLWSLEGRYPPIAQSLAFTGGSGAPAGAELIVVLGAGHAEREGFGPWASLGESARARVIEGVRLSRRFDLPLLFTGYAGTGEVSTAEMNSRAALELGIAPERIAVNSEPRNTAEEAAAVREALAGEVDVAGAADQATNNAIDDAEPRVILVTSASHMPRSVYLFEREGVAVLPAPADYRAASRNYSIWGLLPSAGALRNTERAWYEYLGLAWARLGG